MTSQIGKQLITIHIFPNISRSKNNQAMKFSQLIEYNVRYISLQKSCVKSAMKTNSKLLFVF